MGTLQVGGTTLGVKNTSTNKIDLSNVGDVTLTSSANIKGAINASGDAPIFACRAFVQFDGDNSDNINASGNVSSVDDDVGTGLYTINFTTALASAGYSVVAMSDESSGNYRLNTLSRTSPLSTSSVKIQTINTSNGAFTDSNKTSVAVFL